MRHATWNAVTWIANHPALHRASIPITACTWEPLDSKCFDYTLQHALHFAFDDAAELLVGKCAPELLPTCEECLLLMDAAFEART